MRIFFCKDGLLYCIFIFATGATPQIKLAIWWEKKIPNKKNKQPSPPPAKNKTPGVQFCSLLLCKFHRPFVGNLSPWTTKEVKTRLWDLWKPEYSFQKHNQTKWRVPRILIETNMHPGCPKALKAIQMVSSSLKKLLCNLIIKSQTQFYTVAQSWNHFLSSSMIFFSTIKLKKRLRSQAVTTEMKNRHKIMSNTTPAKGNC